MWHGKTKAAEVKFEIRTVDVGTREVKAGSGLGPAESWVNPGNPVLSIAKGIRIDDLASGPYHLEVQASDSAGNNTEWRAVAFAVE